MRNVDHGETHFKLVVVSEQFLGKVRDIFVCYSERRSLTGLCLMID